MGIAAAIQMNSSQDVKANLQQAERLIAQAAHANATLVVLPENFALMTEHAAARIKHSENFGGGMIQDFLAAAARNFKIWIVGGTLPLRCDEAARVRAACLVFNDHGECVARYDKLHLFDVIIEKGVEEYHESAGIQPGEEIVVVDTPLGKLGLIVCYDIRFPELCRCLFNKGAELISIPAAFTVRTGQAHWEVLARSRAIENFCYVIGAGQTGLHEGNRKTYGHSLIVDPWGTVLHGLADEVGIVTAEIDLEYLREIRRNLPVAAHQRIFVIAQSGT